MNIDWHKLRKWENKFFSCSASQIPHMWPTTKLIDPIFLQMSINNFLLSRDWVIIGSVKKWLELNRWDPFNLMVTTKQLRCVFSLPLPRDSKFVMQFNIWKEGRGNTIKPVRQSEFEFTTLGRNWRYRKQVERRTRWGKAETIFFAESQVLKHTHLHLDFL